MILSKNVALCRGSMRMCEVVSVFGLVMMIILFVWQCMILVPKDKQYLFMGITFVIGIVCAGLASVC